MRFASKCAALLLISVLIYALIFYSCCFILPAAYADSYNKGFVVQLRSLEKSDINTPKIVVLGESFVPFGVDSTMLTELTGAPAYTLGVAAGMGMRYITETVKTFIREGDRIILPVTPFEATYYGMETIFLSIDGEHDLLRSFIQEHPQTTLVDGHIWIVAKLYGSTIAPLTERFRSSVKKAEGVEDAYRLEYFDQNGNYTKKSDTCECPQSELDKREQFSASLFTEAEISFLNNFADYCEDKGAQLLLTWAPIYNRRYTNTPEELQEEEKKLEDRLQAPFISDFVSCMYPEEMIYNSVWHLNSAGKALYTQKLADDLEAFGDAR